jgi:hypothetical protein
MLRPSLSYCKTCIVGEDGGIKVVDLAKEILEKTRPLGQSWVGIIGDPPKIATRIAIGTGAITRLAEMHECDPEVILATDDRLSTTADGLWSIDIDVPVLVVNHGTAELPGMTALAEYVEKQFASIPLEDLPCGFLYQAVT